MLARVAEHLFWLSRYLERSENVARLVLVNTNLMLDLPAGTTPGWRQLISIIGADEAFDEGGPVKDEVAKAQRFLLGDRRHGVSVLSCIDAARENARVCRDLLPREFWERINAFYLFAQEELPQGLTRRGQFNYLTRTIGHSQSVIGLLEGTMNRDEGYAFLLLGRMLERADMTTRILDVRSANVLPETLEELRAFENLQWMSVLRSMSADLMYRLDTNMPITRKPVIEFLLKSESFPRSVVHCLGRVEAQLKRFGHTRRAYRINRALTRRVLETDTATLSQQAFHDFVDEVQFELSNVSTAIGQTYFSH